MKISNRPLNLIRTNVFGGALPTGGRRQSARHGLRAVVAQPSAPDVTRSHAPPPRVCRRSRVRVYYKTCPKTRVYVPVEFPGRSLGYSEGKVLHNIVVRNRKKKKKAKKITLSRRTKSPGGTNIFFFGFFP